MPLTLPDNQTDDYFISAKDDLGLATSQLASGQTVSVTSSDPNTVALTADSTPRSAPDGTPSIASGKVAAGPSPTPNVAVTVTAAVLNSDGSAGTNDKGAAIPPASDTVTIQPGLAASIGELFGVPANSQPSVG